MIDPEVLLFNPRYCFETIDYKTKDWGDERVDTTFYFQTERYATRSVLICSVTCSLVVRDPP